MAAIIPRPSSAHRWASPQGCPGSVQLEARFPDEETESAREGTAAHEMLERHMKQGVPLADMVDTQMSNGVFATSEMHEYIIEFIEYLETIASLESWNCEEKIFIPRVMGQGYGGIPDLFHYDPPYGVLTIPDLKFGYGIVEAIRNWQLINYAVGLVDILEGVKTISIVIYQPRAPHPQGRLRQWHITRDELESFVPQLQQAAALTQQLDAPIRTGPHCTNCKVRRCPAARSAALNAIEVSDIAMLEDYDGATLAIEKVLLDAAYRAIKTRKEAIDTLIEQELKSGIIVPGFMLQRSMSHFKWKEPKNVKALGQILNIDLMKKEQPITPTQAKAAGVPVEILEGLRFREEKSLKLISGNAADEAKRNFDDK